MSNLVLEVDQMGFVAVLSLNDNVHFFGQKTNRLLNTIDLMYDSLSFDVVFDVFH